MTNDQVEKLKALYKEAPANFPDADFMPWDEAPIGETLYRDGVKPVKVIAVEWTEVLASHHCNTCSCLYDNAFLGWWHVDAGYKNRDGSRAILLEYPPTLRRTEIPRKGGA